MSKKAKPSAIVPFIETLKVVSPGPTPYSRLGSPVSGTLWVIDYSFLPPPRKEKLPKAHAKKDEPIAARMMMIAQDPTGSLLFEQAKLLVLGENPYEGNEFKILLIQRGSDVIGFAKPETVDAIAGNVPAASSDPKQGGNDPEPDDGDGGDEDDGQRNPHAALN